MKNISIFSLIYLIMVFGLSVSCNSQTSKDTHSGQDAVSETPQVQQTVNIYYFHGDRRCETCKAVGAVTKETIEEVFADNAAVVFNDINIDDPVNKEVKEKFELSGSGVFVYDGNSKEDLTAFAFQKAVNSPKELSEKIILTVNKMLR